MDNLKIIIQTLSNEEIREFRVFIHRQKRKKERKDLDLFELLLEEKEYKPREVILKLYGRYNKEAYHALRKRLIKHLTDFIVLKRMDEDTSAISPIMGMISLSKYLFDRKADHLAWIYLQRAEKQAKTNTHHGLLNSIYNLMIEESASEYSDDLLSIIARRNKNKKYADEDERASIANAVIREKLREVKLEGKQIDFDKIIEQTYREYELHTIIHRRPKLLYSTLSIARSAILAKKDFFSFEPFIIGQYKEIMNGQGFLRNTHFYKLSFLYAIAHVLYRNKKFTEALNYTVELGENLEAFNRSHYALFHARYVLLHAALKSYTRNNEEAIEILENFIRQEKKYLTTDNSLNAVLNLAVYYFQQQNFKKANYLLMGINHTERWLEKKMGKEWVFKKGLIEVIVQYEVGNDDIALNRIRSVERYFAEMFEVASYNRAKVFIQYVRSYIKNPLIVHDTDFETKVTESLVQVRTIYENIQAITFYAWLKSKIVGLSYYEVLIQLVHHED